MRNLATAPWPFALEDAEAFLAAPRDPAMPSFLITERTDGDPALVGACGLGRRPSGAVELGYWIAPPYWGKGFATEAGRALIDIARALEAAAARSLALPRQSGVGPGAGEARLLPTGISAPRYSCARGGEAMARMFRLALAGGRLAVVEGEQLAA